MYCLIDTILFYHLMHVYLGDCAILLLEIGKTNIIRLSDRCNLQCSYFVHTLNNLIDKDCGYKIDGHSMNIW